MASTRITGVKGHVIIPAAAGGGNINFTRWQADIPQEEHVVTGFDDAGNADVVMGGLIDLKGTAEGFLDSAGVPTLGTMGDDNGAPTALFYLESDGANDYNYKFAGILNLIRHGVDKRGMTAVTVGFESSGDILKDQIPA